MDFFVNFFCSKLFRDVGVVSRLPEGRDGEMRRAVPCGFLSRSQGAAEKVWGPQNMFAVVFPKKKIRSSQTHNNGIADAAPLVVVIMVPAIMVLCNGGQLHRISNGFKNLFRLKNCQKSTFQPMRLEAS